MKTIVQRSYGSPDVVLSLTDAARPVPRPGEVLVEVKATSVNTPDWIAVCGVPRVLRLGSGLTTPKRPVRGSDVAGRVVEVGEGVTDFKVGDSVFGSVWTGEVSGSPHGTFAECVLVPASQLAPLPRGLDFAQGAAAVMSGVTALQSLRDVANVQPGQRVLINGASGGVGLFAVQIARALGAHVTGVCSTRNVELVRAAGAHQVIDYTVEDFTQRAEQWDVVMDNVLNHAPSATARVVTERGVLLANSIGEGEWFGALPSLAWGALFESKRWRTTKFEPSRANLDALAALLESGQVRVIIDSTWPLEDAGKAVARMASRRAAGKVVIQVS
jgi:NADPH:quinone reductase-like Zn-dependent oxidoreductase